MGSHMETRFLGQIAVRILHGVQQDQAGWLIKALMRWIVEGVEPETAEIPEECLGAWIAIREESVAIAALKRERSEAGRTGGKRTQAKGKQTQPDEDGDVDIHPDVSDVGARARAGAGGAVAGHRDIGTSDVGFLSENPRRTSDIGAAASETPETPASRIKAVSWRAWAERLRDPVEAALDATGETSAAARRTYGKRLKDLGRARFLDNVEMFAASLADEPVRNRGAALTRRLDEAVKAKREMEGV